MNSQNLPAHCVVFAVVFLNVMILAIATILFRIAPRGAWPVWAEFLASYTCSSAVIMAVWNGFYRVLLQKRIGRLERWGRYIDLSLTLTAIVVVPLCIFFALNAHFRFL